MLDWLWGDGKYRQQLENSTKSYKKNLETKARLLERLDRFIFHKNFLEARKFLQTVDEERKLELYFSLEELKNLYLYEATLKEDSSTSQNEDSEKKTILTLLSKNFDEAGSLLTQDNTNIFIFKKEEEKIKKLLGESFGKKPQSVGSLSALKRKIASKEPIYLLSASPLQSTKSTEVLTISSLIPQDFIDVVQFAIFWERTYENE